MHPYISLAIAEQRAAEAIRAAEANRAARAGRAAHASRRGQDSRMALAASTHQSHPSYRARRTARRQPCVDGLTVSGTPCR